MSDLRAEVRGALETQRKLEQVARDLHGAPMVQAFRSATTLVHTEAKVLSPVDSGRLRASITMVVEAVGKKVRGVVGSNVVYAAAMETGTRPHWPPLRALERWARRHGTTAYVVARAIARRGTKPRRYLQGAFEKHKRRIQEIVKGAVSGIVKK